jgi:hypothetical protein
MDMWGKADRAYGWFDLFNTKLNTLSWNTEENYMISMNDEHFCAEDYLILPVVHLTELIC